LTQAFLVKVIFWSALNYHQLTGKPKVIQICRKGWVTLKGC